MDAMNRKTSMALMVCFQGAELMQIETALFAVGKQFILITPQDMGNVALRPEIRVHRFETQKWTNIRMCDPERGQGVIEFSQLMF